MLDIEVNKKEVSTLAYENCHFVRCRLGPYPDRPRDMCVCLSQKIRNICGMPGRSRSHAFPGPNRIFQLRRVAPPLKPTHAAERVSIRSKMAYLALSRRGCRKMLIDHGIGHSAY